LEVLNLDNNLGQLLESLRGKMSLREVANVSGLSHTYIRDVERGINRSTKAPVKPSPDTLRRLAEAYKYSYAELMKVAGYLGEETEDIDDDLPDVNRIAAHMESEYGEHDPAMAKFLKGIIREAIQEYEDKKKRDDDDDKD
jgi:transcriptional regulator with XRE-family HTH domain